MNHTDINRRLALAIGYEPSLVRVLSAGGVVVWRKPRGEIGAWSIFNYRDHGTIYPIAERYKMFPTWLSLDGQFWVCRGAFNDRVTVYNTCPRACVAHAVIEASERGLL